MRKFQRHLQLGCALVASAGLLVACGGSSSGDSSATGSSSVAYSGPGSKWDVTLEDSGDFTIERRTSPVDPVILTVEGTYERLDSGFVSLEVGSANGTDAPNPGDMAWALEVPGYAFLLKPIDGDQVIAMVTAGECPTTDIDANWVMVKKRAGSDATSQSEDYFGTFEFDVSTSTPSLPVKRSLDTGFPNVTEGGISGGGSCEDGLMLVGEMPDVAAMYLTQSGGAIVQTDIADEANSSFVFGLSADAVEGSNLDGDFAGMLFDDTMADGSKINPVSLSCESGVCTGALVTDIETGSLSSDTVTVTFTGLAGEDFISGTIEDSDSNSGNLVCMADQNAAGSGKTIVSCVGQSPGDNTQMFNVMFVSR
ncbi:hypothetical protein [Marinobacter sp. CHS3-4]|uniref:hypothetical protein n=1 Tax=Marinobacter sp. CHS3-4 TaxID=3045174 RepID=UPI0024B5CBAF|nr:hypothetical protein [Marinobacter sp. CHS3-4]MDI9246010.1 hypothetical protein [Marinobacter sp. CHS3-4]